MASVFGTGTPSDIVVCLDAPGVTNRHPPAGPGLGDAPSGRTLRMEPPPSGKRVGTGSGRIERLKPFRFGAGLSWGDLFTLAAWWSLGVLGPWKVKGRSGWTPFWHTVRMEEVNKSVVLHDFMLRPSAFYGR